MSALRKFVTDVVGPALGAQEPAVLKQNTADTLVDGAVAFQGEPQAPVLHTGPAGAAGPSRSPPPTGVASVPEEELDAKIGEMDSIPQLTNKARVKELVKRILELLEQELARPGVQQRISDFKEKVRTGVLDRSSAIKAYKAIALELLHRITKQVEASEQPTSTADPDFNSKIHNSVVSIVVATKLVKERLEGEARKVFGDSDTLDPSALDEAVAQSHRERLIVELRRIPQDIRYVQERIKALEKERATSEELSSQLTEIYARTKDEGTGKTLSETNQRIKKINEDIKDYKDEVERAFPAKEKKLLGDIAKEPMVSRGGRVSLLERWLMQRYQNDHPELWRDMRVE